MRDETVFEHVPPNFKLQVLRLTIPIVRPILDERGKKVWELLICDADRTWEYSEYFPNNKINSVSLKAALERIMSAPGAVRPEKCKFFRGQMQTIISRALTDVGIKPIPSRRCFTLMNWLEERLETTYSKNPGYNTGATTAFTLELGSPQDLPDALRGEAWAFVQLPAAQLQKEAEAVRMGKAFGDSFDLAKNVKGLKPDTLIPGVAVFSRRAAPLAAWTNGLELAAVTADVERACLVLETGVNQRWRYGAYRRNPNADQEAESWERAKKFAQGLHFLAVQPDAESEEVSGIWLLQNRDLPNL